MGMIDGVSTNASTANTNSDAGPPKLNGSCLAGTMDGSDSDRGSYLAKMSFKKSLEVPDDGTKSLNTSFHSSGSGGSSSNNTNNINAATVGRVNKAANLLGMTSNGGSSDNLKVGDNLRKLASTPALSLSGTTTTPSSVRASSGSTTGATERRVSFMKPDKAARLLGMETEDVLGALPRTSEHSDVSNSAHHARKAPRFGKMESESFGDDDGSVITFDGPDNDQMDVRKKKSMRKKVRKGAGKLMSSMRRKANDDDSKVVGNSKSPPMSSMRRKTNDDDLRAVGNFKSPPTRSDSSPAAVVHFSGEQAEMRNSDEFGAASAAAAPPPSLRTKMARGLSRKWGGPDALKQASFAEGDGINPHMDYNSLERPERSASYPESRKSVSNRRDNLDAKSLCMGLDLESANFLDWMTQAKCEEWLKSLCRRDPRACIKTFFDDVARDGADSIEKENGFQPELLSPLLSMFQRSSVFSVWRPTSVDSIRKMMTGQGTGKGLDIKGKSAKRGKLSAYVPFLQIHEDEHKKKIRSLPRDGRIRIFYKKREARDKAHKILSEVMGDMMETANLAMMILLQSEKVANEEEELAQDDRRVGRVLSSFHSLSVQSMASHDEQEKIQIVNDWEMAKPKIIVIDDYSPKCFGLDLPKRLFWEGYVMRAKDITRPPGSMYDTGRPSRASFQDMNFASILDEPEEEQPRAVVWQYTDPYLPPTEPDPDPMMPQTLLMAYEEHGRVMPVVSDFDCFLLGTRGVRFHSPLPEEQVELVHNMINDVETILKDCREGKSKNWTASWLHVMKHQKKHIKMPKYGFGDPKSYAIMKYAVQRLEEHGAVRHGAECFNFYFPQELDDEFLVIGGNLPGAKYKYMKLNELQDFLSGCIDLGFTFPLNPKWVLCDEGWKALWDKLTGSVHPNVQLSINAWYPPGSGLKERIKEIQQKYPEGFQSDLSGRKKGTQAWDEAEVALDRYQRIQRAKRKLWVVLCFISNVQRAKKKANARQDASEAGSSDDVGEMEGPSSGKEGGLEVEEEPAEKRVSFQDTRRLSMTSQNTNGSDDVIKQHTIDAIANMGEMNATHHVRANTEDFTRPPAFSERFRRSSSLSCEENQDIDVIDSLIGGNLQLSEHQQVGLQRIREQLANKSGGAPQPRINNRFERRHTSIDGRITAMMLEDVPSFILKEYGGVKQGEVSMSFKAQVKKIMSAQRMIGTANGKQKHPHGNDHFLPVEWTTMSKESKQKLAEKLSFASLSRWDYNVIEVAKLCNGSPLLFVGWAIMGSPHAQQAMASDLGHDVTETSGYNFITEFCVQMPILCSFLRTVESDYLPNPYHNNTHAADVVQTLNTMLQLGGKEYATSPLDLFSILVAAVIHDVKHPGLNNNYQVNSHSELSVQYNDVSVLENYSIAWLFSKLLGQTRDFTVDIFSGLSKEQFSKARSIIIRSVLETDMTHHFALLKKMGVHQDVLKGKGTEEWLQSYTNEGVNYDPSMDMLCFLLHQADISNPAKPHPLFITWADNILAESYAQGDMETSLSLPVSPLCDRVTTDKKQSQIGFIKFVVQPSYQLLGEIIPLFARTVFPHIDKSLDFWDNYGNEDDSFDSDSV